MDAAAGILRNASELHWIENEPGSGRPELRTVLFGDPAGAGVYTFRLRLPGTYEGGRPHWHPDYEFGTVLSGTLLVAAGARLDRESAKRLTAGAFIVIPPKVVHAIWTEGEVVLQIHGPGPRATSFERRE